MCMCVYVNIATNCNFLAEASVSHASWAGARLIGARRGCVCSKPPVIVGAPPGALQQKHEQEDYWQIRMILHLIFRERGDYTNNDNSVVGKLKTPGVHTDVLRRLWLYRELQWAEHVFRTGNGISSAKKKWSAIKERKLWIDNASRSYIERMYVWERERERERVREKYRKSYVEERWITTGENKLFYNNEHLAFFLFLPVT